MGNLSEHGHPLSTPSSEYALLIGHWLKQGEFKSLNPLIIISLQLKSELILGFSLLLFRKVKLFFFSYGHINEP